MILEVFRQLGKVEVVIEILNNFVKIGAITLEANLRYFTGGLSDSALLNGSNFCSSINTSFIDVKRKKKNF